MNDKHFLLLFQYQICEHEEIEVNENHLVTRKTKKKQVNEKINRIQLVFYYILFLYVFLQPIFEVVQDNFLQMDLIDQYNDEYIHHQYFLQLRKKTINKIKYFKSIQFTLFFLRIFIYLK